MFLKKGVIYYIIVSLWLFFIILTACTSTENTSSLEKTKANPIATTATSNLSKIQTYPIVSTTTPQPTSTRKVYLKNPTDIPPFPFSEPGPYHVGVRREIIFVDASRNNREVNLVIWYPALKNAESDSLPTTDAIADMTAAPYPVIMSASKDGSIFGTLLASYGFVYIGINRLFAYDHFGKETFDQPLDFLFAINQVSNSIIAGLDGVINTQIIGTMGYSFDGINSLLLSGARIDPGYYFTYCQQAPGQQPPLEDWYLDLYCEQSGNWVELSDYLGKDITKSMDGLWQPFNDERIKAVMPMAVDGAWLLGEKGLAAADRPALMIQASNDSQYQPTEGAFIFEHYGSKDKAMISFLNQSHSMIYNPVQIAKMSHFAVAFFSHQLQDKEDMAYYYSQEFIEQDDDLAFGFYSEE